MQRLDGEHGVHRQGVLGGGSVGGILHQIDRLGGLDAEVGGVGAGYVGTGGSGMGVSRRSDVDHRQQQCQGNDK